MTDQTYTDAFGTELLEIRSNQHSLPENVVTIRQLTDSREGAVALTTAELLAMIDSAAPDALRAYLRERADLIDAPDESCSTLEDMLPADLAAEAARYRIDATPEADSPEDVDETPTDETERRLHIIERLAKILRAGTDSVEVCTLADWVIDR